MNRTTRWAGALCLAAAGLIVSSDLLRMAIGLQAGSGPVATMTHTLIYGVALAGMYALLLALSALYFGNQRTLGALGRVGYLTASLGTVLVAGDWWFEAFVVPRLSVVAPDVLNLPPGGSIVAGAGITAGLFAVGWVMFGVAVLRSGAFSRPAAILLVAGGAIGLLGLSTPYLIPLAVAVGWLGYTVRRTAEQEPSVAQTSRSASTIVGGMPSR
jgi:hypothetical protein